MMMMGTAAPRSPRRTESQQRRRPSSQSPTTSHHDGDSLASVLEDISFRDEQEDALSAAMMETIDLSAAAAAVRLTGQGRRPSHDDYITTSPSSVESTRSARPIAVTKPPRRPETHAHSPVGSSYGTSAASVPRDYKHPARSSQQHHVAHPQPHQHAPGGDFCCAVDKSLQDRLSCAPVKERSVSPTRAARAPRKSVSRSGSFRDDDALSPKPVPRPGVSRSSSCRRSIASLDLVDDPFLMGQSAIWPVDGHHGGAGTVAHEPITVLEPQIDGKSNFVTYGIRIGVRCPSSLPNLVHALNRRQTESPLVYRRYSEFESFRTELSRLYPYVIIPPIPEKHGIGKPDPFF